MPRTIASNISLGHSLPSSSRTNRKRIGPRSATPSDKILTHLDPIPIHTDSTSSRPSSTGSIIDIHRSVRSIRDISLVPDNDHISSVVVSSWWTRCTLPMRMTMKSRVHVELHRVTHLLHIMLHCPPHILHPVPHFLHTTHTHIIRKIHMLIIWRKTLRRHNRRAMKVN
ncbi:hypothetical protein AGABI1DRAFT_115636 [Agaricus bisporus var. burnettii JB137-S8]|uniref:Uncharacterized protein n=1 Tax=Agaricus bisporus var. burnettii (strain JB137-S8 / ATCC MYA-4627 / FGSC 10392) TaxID=597362 RepID=K5WN57_AGABU|nr:uncharacterized protein AGABI1DRAFT_115636 [Agaricus bisporus var. burnettii JB137-S8]EKM76756.1 hypothetical protein AGABI1DRAFT_115636 [Agaricus bisporus var. burnettii JB137-S8]